MPRASWCGADIHYRLAMAPVASRAMAWRRPCATRAFRRQEAMFGGVLLAVITPDMKRDAAIPQSLSPRELVLPRTVTSSS